MVPFSDGLVNLGLSLDQRGIHADEGGKLQVSHDKFCDLGQNGRLILKGAGPEHEDD